MFLDRWKTQIGTTVTVKYMDDLDGAYAAKDEGKGLLRFGMPFMRNIWKYGQDLGDTPLNRTWFSQAAVRTVLYHELGHILQFFVIKADDEYWSIENTKWRELEADSISGAIFLVVQGWDTQALRASWLTIFSLGDISFNAVDPHGWPPERQAYVMDAAKYVDRETRTVRLEELHKTQFKQDKGPKIAGFRPREWEMRLAGFRDSLNSMGYDIEYGVSENIPAKLQKLAAGDADGIYSGRSLYGLVDLARPQDFKWTSPIGEALRASYAIQALASRGCAIDSLRSRTTKYIEAANTIK